MSTYYSPGCDNEKAHVCDVCQFDNGQITLYWKAKDFDICLSCLTSLFSIHVCPTLKKLESISVKRTVIQESLRNEVFSRDNYKCCYCGSDENIQIDHKKPFSIGGTTEKDNLQTLCKKCNLKKGSRDIEWRNNVLD